MGCTESIDQTKSDYYELGIADLVENQEVSWSPRKRLGKDEQASPAGSRVPSSPSGSVNNSPAIPIPENYLVSEKDLKFVRRARGLAIRYLNLEKNQFLSAGLEFLHCKISHTEWRCAVKKGNIAVFSAMTNKSDWAIYKGDAILKGVVPQHVLRLLLNEHRCKEYDESIAESMVFNQVTDRISIRRLVAKFPWPAAWRDYYVVTVWDELPNKSYLVCTMSIDSEDTPSATKGCTRGNILCNGIWLRSAANGDCLVKVVSHVELGGSISPKIANRMGHHTVLKLLSNLEKTMDRTSVRLSPMAIKVDSDIQKAISKRSVELREWMATDQALKSSSAILEHAESASKVPPSERIDKSVRRVLFLTPDKDGKELPTGNMSDEVVEDKATIVSQQENRESSGTSASFSSSFLKNSLVQWILISVLVILVVSMGFMFGQRFEFKPTFLLGDIQFIEYETEYLQPLDYYSI